MGHLFLAFFLQLKRMICAIERYAYESAVSWSTISAPFQHLLHSLLKNEFFRHFAAEHWSNIRYLKRTLLTSLLMPRLHRRLWYI